MNPTILACFTSWPRPLFPPRSTIDDEFPNHYNNVVEQHCRIRGAPRPPISGMRERVHQPFYDMLVRGVGVTTIRNMVDLFRTRR